MAKNEILAAFEVMTSDTKVSLGLIFSGLANSAFSTMFVMFPAWTRLVLGMSQAQTAAVPLYFNIVWALSLIASPTFARYLGNIKTVYFGMFCISLGMAL